METFANTAGEFAKERAPLPLRPVAAGTCAKLPAMPSGDGEHLLLAVRAGSARVRLPDGVGQMLVPGWLLYVCAGVSLQCEAMSEDLSCEFVRFEAAVSYTHLTLPTKRIV